MRSDIKEWNFFDKSINYLFISLVFLFPFSISIRNLILGLIIILYLVKILFLKINKQKILTPETIINKELIIFFVISILSLFKVEDLNLGIDGLISPVIRNIFFFYIGSLIIFSNHISKYKNTLFYGSITFIISAALASKIYREDFFHGNGTGTWATFVVFFCISLIFASDFNIYKKIISILTAGAGVLILFHTTSRGATIGFFVGIIVLISLLIWEKVNNLKTVIASVLILITIMILITPYILPDSLMNKFNNITEDIESHGSLYTRVVMWKSSLYMMKSNPVLGVGIGNFKPNYHNYIDNVIKEKNSNKISRDHDHPHNLFLHIGAEMGIIALIISLIIIYKVIKISLINFKTYNPGNPGNYLALANLSSISALLVHSMVDTTIRYGHVGYFIILLTIFNLKYNQNKLN
ncbi:MAG: O-antigen ligase family protein [bacterium]